MRTRRLIPAPAPVLVAALALVLVLALVARAGEGAGEAAGEAEWSPVVYPLQRLPLTFSHATHAARGTPCAACHPAATSSRSAVDNLLPTEGACRACHAIDRAQPARPTAPGIPPTRCLACHPGYSPDAAVERTYIPPPAIKFDHAAHATTPCARCHGDLRSVGLATARHLPTMALCLECHASGRQQRACGDCHPTLRTGLVQTRFAQGTLVPSHTGLGDGHGPGFATDHREEARQIGATCEACHDRSECIGCHQGEVKPMDFHPGGYVRTHAVDARRGTPDCSACHRAQSFCVGCHQRTGVAEGASTGFDQDDPDHAFHPGGWVSTTGGGNLHAREARRNLTACASCHREEDCQTCHSATAGAPHISPHPRGWRGSSQCRALDRGNRRMCLRCHVTQVELGCDWSAAAL